MRSASSELQRCEDGVDQTRSLRVSERASVAARAVVDASVDPGQEWVDLRLAEGYDGPSSWKRWTGSSTRWTVSRTSSVDCGAMSGLCADVVRPESIDFQFLCRNDRRWEAELYICAGEDENKSVEQRHRAWRGRPCSSRRKAVV